MAALVNATMSSFATLIMRYSFIIQIFISFEPIRCSRAQAVFGSSERTYGEMHFRPHSHFSNRRFCPIKMPSFDLNSCGRAPTLSFTIAVIFRQWCRMEQKAAIFITYGALILIFR